MQKKHWIKSSIKHPGALRRSLGIRRGHKIPKSKLSAAAKGNSVTAKRAREAITLAKLRKR